MMYMGSGYSLEYSRVKTNRVAKALKHMIPKAMQITGADAVVVRGTSGLSAAFAALVYVDFNLVHLRKHNDGSHGSPVEGHKPFRKYLILDDFIDSGETVRGIIADLAGLARQQGAEVECVGALMYGSDAFASGYMNLPVWYFMTENFRHNYPEFFK